MSEPSSRREMITQSAAGLAGLATLGIPESAWARQGGEERVTLTDYTDAFRIDASETEPRVRCVDLRTLTSWTTPNEDQKSIVTGVTRVCRGVGWQYRIAGPAWGGQVPIRAVEVFVDGGPWQAASIDALPPEATRHSSRAKCGWVLWSLTLPDLAEGTHRLVSRAIDQRGKVQPTKAERDAEIASGREDNSQWTREIRVVA